MFNRSALAGVESQDDGRSMKVSTETIPATARAILSVPGPDPVVGLSLSNPTLRHALKGEVAYAVLVTGAAGFIGSHLCDYLLSLGHEVAGIDILVPRSTGR